MKDPRKIIFIAILPVIFLLLMTFWVFVKVNSTDEELVEYILPMTFNGRIIDKKVDYRNHAAKSVIVKSYNSKPIVLANSLWNSIFDSSMIGDSVYKIDGSLSLFILDKNGNEKEIKYIPSRLYFHKRNWKK